jgi:hypothetical protein
VPDPVAPLPEFEDDEVEVDVCAVAAGEPALLEFADDEVDVAVWADELPVPESPAVVLDPVVVEAEAWAPGDEGVDEVTPDGFGSELPAVVVEVVPVDDCAVDPFEFAWVPVEVVVPVWAFELPPAAWVPVDVVVPACALELPRLAWLPVEGLVLVWAFEAPEPAWLPVDVAVFACALGPPDDVVAVGAVPVGLEVAVDGEVVVDVLLVCNAEDPPVEFVAGESVLSGLDDQWIE